MLAMHCAEDTVDGDRSIFAAVVAGDIDSVRTFLENGGDPNLKAAKIHRGLQSRDLLVLVDSGDTLLCVAVYLRLDDVSALLIRAGADWEQPSADGSTSHELAMSLDENMFQRVNALAATDACELRPVTERSEAMEPSQEVELNQVIEPKQAAGGNQAIVLKQAAVPNQAMELNQAAEPNEAMEHSQASEPNEAMRLKQALEPNQVTDRGQSASCGEGIVTSGARKSSGSESGAPKRAVVKRGSSFKQMDIDNPLQQSLKMPLARDLMAMHGYMLKKSTGVVHKWQSRYFVLTIDSQLLYFDDDMGPSQGTAPKGIIDLAGSACFLTSVELLPYRQQVQLSLLELKFSDGSNLALRVHDDEGLARLWLSNLERAVSIDGHGAKDAGAAVQVTGCGAQDQLVTSAAQQKSHPRAGQTCNFARDSKGAAPCNDGESDNCRGRGRRFLRHGSFRKAKKDAVVTAAEDMTSQDVVKEGWLQKKAQGLRHSWQKRYFVLIRSVLLHYSDASKKSVRGNLPLSLTTSVTLSEYYKTGENVLIHIVHNGELYEFRTEDESSAQEWYTHLMAVCQADPIGDIAARDTSSVTANESTLEGGDADDNSVAHDDPRATKAAAAAAATS